MIYPEHFIENSNRSQFATARQKLNGEIPGLFGRLNDGENDFFYTCYVTSPFLDEAVRSERTDFEIDEDDDDLFENAEITIQDVKSAVIGSIKTFLGEYLQASRKAGKERVEDFTAQKAPRYRSILSRIPEDDLYVDPEISDKDLELYLHKYLADLERQCLADGHEIMKPKINENGDEYHKRVESYLNSVDILKESDLANYVKHRRIVIDLLEQAIKRQTDGKYVKEEIIHDLIMPRGKDSTEIFQDESNLWLIDERLAFHNYLASDKTLLSMPITDSTETKEPDILSLNVFDNPFLVNEGENLPLASITVVEIKRPLRNDAKEGEEKDPIEQALGYLNRIRQGQVSTASGRPIPNSQSIPGFCYVLSDLTPTIIDRCKMKDLKVTSDGLGYFGYNGNFNAYIEVISFNRLVNAVKERNRAFFDKLGLPTR